MTTSELRTRTVGEIATEMPLSIRVFESWRIDYCCGGRTPLADACAVAGKSVDDFIVALESSATGTGIATDVWSDEPLATVSARIVEQYHRYTREELQTLETLAARVLHVHGDRRPELAAVAARIQETATSLVPHMLKEEQVLFPYVDALARAEEGKGVAPTPFFGTVKNPVRMMMLEHDAVGELLENLRELTSNYTPPESACFSYRELYRRLAEFEQITHEHVHVENNIYFPRAVALEDRMGNAAAFPDPHAHGAMCAH